MSTFVLDKLKITNKKTNYFRSKNTVNIITKNMLDCLVAGVAYWAIGWAVAYGPGGNQFVGGSNFFMYGVEFSEYPRWFFQFTFAATTATIVSGSIAERCEFEAYFVYSVAITGKFKKSDQWFPNSAVENTSAPGRGGGRGYYVVFTTL